MSHLKKVKNKKKNLYRAAEYNTAIYQSHFFVVLDVRKKTLRSRIEIKVSIFMLFLVVCIFSKLKKKITFRFLMIFQDPLQFAYPYFPSPMVHGLENIDNDISRKLFKISEKIRNIESPLEDVK